MKASQVAQVLEADGFSFGLTDGHTVVTHSRGTSWVVQSPTGAYLTVVLTEGGNHITAVLPSNFGAPKTAKAPKQDWLLGTVTIGRNVLKARRFSNGDVQRLTRTGEWIAFTGTAKFTA